MHTGNSCYLQYWGMITPAIPHVQSYPLLELESGIGGRNLLAPSRLPRRKLNAEESPLPASHVPSLLRSDLRSNKHKSICTLVTNVTVNIGV